MLTLKDNIYSTKRLRNILETTKEKYILISTAQEDIKFIDIDKEEIFRLACENDAGVFYSNYTQNNTLVSLNDYLLGSVRNDFDFGKLITIDTTIAKKVIEEFKEEYSIAGLYQLILGISRISKVYHSKEKLYSVEKIEKDINSDQFSYVDPKNLNAQKEYEIVFLDHLKKIKAYLNSDYEKIDLNKNRFFMEASVIIPVKNREKTISDAIDSALKQKTNFRFNIIIVDNHSTDNTSNIIREKSSYETRIIHLIPEKTDLGIGGCWAEAINCPICGKFAIQLDSDDLYSDENTLQKIVDKFYSDNCAMVIGSYTLCDFNLETIPPGIIDHKEWTEKNGRNNALRINGLGAPRAFFTPIARKLEIPNVSYGEDYAMELQICRKYKISRIYDSLYMCRRWKENSDAKLDQDKLNKFNEYKDGLRSKEILERQKLN